MIEYRVRSVSLLNLVNDIRHGRLIPDAYFQRNLVWRDIHKKDFVKTILLGYPFPQIFISKGKVDVESMTTVSCIVDGQQRTNAINAFLADEFDVDGLLYSELSDAVRAEFLKYEVAIIELDLENDDPKVQEIFQRINRTSNSLTVIEKMASEYSTAEYMLVAKLLAEQIDLDKKGDIEDFRIDPNIPAEFYTWAASKKISKFTKLLNEKGVFDSREIARKANLMHVLNIMTTVLAGFYNRNEKTIEFLNNYLLAFDARDEVVDLLERAADVVLKCGLSSKSYWLNKANIFSLVVAIANAERRGQKIEPSRLKAELGNFEAEIPEDYRLAAAEAVNSTRARILRNTYLERLLQNSLTAPSLRRSVIAEDDGEDDEI